MSGPLVLGTAGHVDHGKTALVLALTGRDTDRLAAEKSRGISIELGFAPLALPCGRAVSLVDVPGHERFVRHMVAGASGVDGYLLCVAADDGVMPQTREHMDVLGLLGVHDGVVAVTRADLAPTAAAAAAGRELVGPGPEVVPVSAVTGEGVERLRGALDRLAARLPRRTAGGRPRLFVDRSFSLPGPGTIVTGTLWGEGIARGDRVAVLPGGAAGRVREMQAHDRAIARAAGGRTALNLAGVASADVPRGACVVRAGDSWDATDLLDVALNWLPGAGRRLRSRERLQAFIGTAEVPAACILLDADALEPGERGYAQLRLGRPVPAAAGDRVVLRSAERRTVGGGAVIDAAPARHGRGARAAERLAALESAAPARILGQRLRDAGADGLPGEPDHAAVAAAGGVVLPGGVALDRGVAADARQRLLGALERPRSLAAARAATGLGPAAADALLAALAETGEIERDGAVVRPPEATPPAGAEEVARALADGGLRPPPVGRIAEQAGLTRAEAEAALAHLRTQGRAVRAGDVWFDAGAAAAAREHARRALASGPMTLGALRDLWGVGRRHAAALAAHLDATGLTRRRGDSRELRRGAAPG
ncbi:MAG TPA: selenocysteine-specific translation elongation factor [Miltoncostaeaceae bacterium]|nr:selenocysteine-specific translation elongation factor [Miltoncostaeaceae bacterium]